MIADNQLILGVVLITIGIAFGLLAYAVMLNRREAETEEADEQQSQGEAQKPAAEPEPGVEPDEQPEEQTILIPSAELAEQSSSSSEKVKRSIPADPGRIPIATLARDEVTGRLIITMEDHDYRDAADISDDGHRRKLEYAVADLSKWFETEKERKRPAPVEEPAEQHRGMIEEINEFLKKKLRHLPVEKQAVRLVEGTGGSVKVYIGIDSYELEEVPDENVKQLIREAVADWEASQ
jgi:hypothetical protein